VVFIIHVYVYIYRSVQVNVITECDGL